MTEADLFSRCFLCTTKRYIYRQISRSYLVSFPGTQRTAPQSQHMLEQENLSQLICHNPRMYGPERARGGAGAGTKRRPTNIINGISGAGLKECVMNSNRLPKPCGALELRSSQRDDRANQYRGAQPWAGQAGQRPSGASNYHTLVGAIIGPWLVQIMHKNGCIWQCLQIRQKSCSINPWEAGSPKDEGMTYGLLN